MQAKVKYPNTPQSDRQRVVMHVVTLDDGTTVELPATDPGDAIARVKAVSDGVFLGTYCSGTTMCGCGGGWFTDPKTGKEIQVTHQMLRDDPELRARIFDQQH